jgi:CHAT domain-containing protein/tetratricopeptide (TPR) repeat protein
MISFLLLTGALVQGLTARPPTTACPKLVARKDISVASSPMRPACVMVRVAHGEALQIVADYPEDVALYVSGGGREFLVDGFEFGRETLTLNAAGQYRIEIRTAGGETPKNARLTVLMSLNPLSLQAAAAWQEAELAATTAKGTKKREDYTVSLKLWHAMGQSSAEARTLMMLGDVIDHLGDFRVARENYEQALEICRAYADLRCAAEAANNSGNDAQKLGEFSESFSRFQEAAKDWQELSLPQRAGQTYSNLGIWFSRAGDFGQALIAYDRARTLLKNGGEPLWYARVLSNLGLCYIDMAQPTKAQIYFQQAIHTETGIKGAEDDLIRSRMNLGRSLMLEGRYLEALPLLKMTVAKAASRENIETRVYTLNNLGQLLWHLHHFDTAESRMKSALELYRRLGDKRGEAVALHYLGLIARDRGSADEARSMLDQARQVSLDYGLRDYAVDSLYELAELELAAGNAIQAKSLAEEAILLLEAVRSRVPGATLRASFYARRRNLLELLVTIAMRPDNQDATVDGLIAAEFGRGRALLDLLAERQLSTPEPVELTQQQARIRRDIMLLSQRKVAAPDKQENLRRQIEALIARDLEVGAQIKDSINKHEPGARPLTSITDLQRDVLSPQRAILEYQLGERVSYVWIVRDQQIKVFKLPPRAVVERQVAAATGLFNRILERQRDPGMQAAFKKAMLRLSATLLGCFKAADLPQSVILVLDGDLNRVPFAALRFSDHEYMGFHHDLLQAPSAAFLLQGTAPRPVLEFPKSVLALYDPIFSADDPRAPAELRKRKGLADTHFARLPFNEELKTIAFFVPRSRYHFMGGADANTQALQGLPLEQYALLHFSTHAIIDDDIPERSRIALSIADRQGRPVNGFLLPYQLADLRMKGAVVVLSACDTALGKKVMGEGMMGFASSLFSAGASQLILTIAEVDAQASSSFLSNTYRHFLGRNRTSMEHALTLARQSFLKSDRWSDPYYWASYVVVGMPTPPNQSAKDKPRQDF